MCTNEKKMHFDVSVDKTDEGLNVQHHHKTDRVTHRVILKRKEKKMTSSIPTNNIQPLNETQDLMDGSA